MILGVGGFSLDTMRCARDEAGWRLVVWVVLQEAG